MNQSSSSPSHQFDLAFRPITEGDQPFLQGLYGSTRAAELAMVPWSDEEKDAFIAMQFNAQHSFYQQQFGEADFFMVTKDKENIGRLYLDHRSAETRIIDIALLPRYQRMGIGKQLLTDVIEAARQRGVPVTIHVEKNNPAMSLYRRLGFELREDQGVYDLMQWSVET